MMMSARVKVLEAVQDQKIGGKAGWVKM